MKYFILCLFIITSVLSSSAQSNSVNSLPDGHYQTKYKSGPGTWDAGDIILLGAGKYKTSGVNELGQYKFSSAAQRIFFTSGPLKGVYAITSISNNLPVIMIPVNENSTLNLASEVWGYYRQ